MYVHISTIADVDECEADPYPCDANAECLNVDGGYICYCEEGFTGDGTTCTCECFSFQFPLISVAT